jgi:hypothetical protein
VTDASGRAAVPGLLSSPVGETWISAAKAFVVSEANKSQIENMSLNLAGLERQWQVVVWCMREVNEYRNNCNSFTRLRQPQKITVRFSPASDGFVRLIFTSFRGKI